MSKKNYLNKTDFATAKFLALFETKLPSKKDYKRGDRVKLDLVTPMLVEFKPGYIKDKTWDNVSKYIGTIGYLNQFSLRLYSNHPDLPLKWEIEKTRIKVEGERAIQMYWQWISSYLYLYPVKKNAKQVFVKMEKPDTPPDPAIDILGVTLSVGDHVTFQGSHAVDGGDKKFTAIGQIKRFSDKGLVFVNLLWVPEDWRKTYPVNFEKRVWPYKILRLDEMDLRITELKLMS